MAEYAIQIELLTKFCSKCKAEKWADEFWKSAATKDGLQRWCKACFNIGHKERNRRHISSGRRWSKQRDDHYQRKFGITAADYDRMAEAQNGLCAICDGPPGAKALHVDHDHATGRIRGLLCGNCNRGIGYLKDDPDRVKSALAYLRRTS